MKFLTCIIFCILLFSCKNTNYEEPIIDLSAYKIEEGFDLSVVASEPFLDAPVAIDFDAQGRIWVVDMPGFMNGETDPVGSIKILEDIDSDGVADHAKIVLDSLIMPRALALVYGGVLYAEPPNLWFAELENDKVKSKTLVDSLYVLDGNPEHQPNGLLMNLDNWIYSAKSNFRYQKKEGKWIKEATSFRGQWGISKDDFGRLYYNNNSRQLLGDYVLPNRLIRNKFYTPKEGLNKILTNDQRVYPLNSTPVNRGYIDGVLDKDSLLIKFTAACGPLVYRGNNFTDSYYQNVFVCEPAANLVKRNVLSFNGIYTEANQAWQGKEFLASTDVGFRPVNISNGPDGNMYVVDMHRGVIQHSAFMSPYLKRISAESKLDSLVDFGRILKVSKVGVKNQEIPDLNSLSDSKLVDLLKNENGWIRDKVQQLIIHKADKHFITLLNELLQDVKYPLGQIHALYTLKGLNALSFEGLINVAKHGSVEVGAHAVILLEDFASTENVKSISTLFSELVGKNSMILDFYIGSTLGNWLAIEKERFLPLVNSLAKKYTDHKIFQETLVSGFSDSSLDLQNELIENTEDKKILLYTVLSKNIEQFKNNKPNSVFVKIGPTNDPRSNGSKLFRQICSACHGSDGNGIDGLAPPLLNSEYLKSDMERLGLILLHGLEGPVTVHGRVYNFDATMPGLIHNDKISDKDLSDIISYITNAFTQKPNSLRPQKIKELRLQQSESNSEFTEAELNKLFSTH